MEALDADLALDVYAAAFCDPSEWRFVFSGKISPANLRRLADKYLASIPARPSRPKPPRLLGLPLPPCPEA